MSIYSKVYAKSKKVHDFSISVFLFFFFNFSFCTEERERRINNNALAYGHPSQTIVDGRDLYFLVFILLLGL